MKKFKKNKFVVLAVCVAIVSCVYFVAQKAIDEYSFWMNGDIISEDDAWATDDDESEGNDGKSAGERVEEGEKDSGKVPEEEADLVLEEKDESESSAGSDGVGSPDEVTEAEDAKNKIYVYITGEVKVPGVVILKNGSRIVDAINAAGGTTAKANISKVNLVYVLEDGMKVNIPNDNDLKNNPDFEYITMSSGDGAAGGSSGTSGGSGGGKEGSYGSSTGATSYGVVNINTATQTELETLPGIGPSLALSIINYRKENGKFSSIEEIKNVSGIGDAKFEKMKSFITI